MEFYYDKGDLLVRDVMKDEDEDYPFYLSSILGSRIKNPGEQNFSFYFSPALKNHKIRVLPTFFPENRNRIAYQNLGFMELHGEYRYIPSEHDRNVPIEEIQKMRDFFKFYKVLFAAVWASEVNENEISNYIQGYCDFKEMIQNFYEYETNGKRKPDLEKIKNLTELEAYVRATNWFDMCD